MVMSLVNERSAFAIGDRKVSYTAKGSLSGKQVLFFHGQPNIGDSGLDARYLASINVLLLATSRPGYGNTTPMGERKLHEANEDWLPLLERFGSNEKAVAVGVSGGAMYAACAAAIYPEFIGELIIMGGGIPRRAVEKSALGSTNAQTINWTDEEFRRYTSTIASAMKKDPYGQIEILKQDSRLQNVNHPDRLCFNNPTIRHLLAWTGQKSMTGKYGVDGWCADFHAICGPLTDFDFKVPRDIPTLIIHGRQDIFTPPSNVSWLLQNIAPHGESIVLDNCGHTSMAASLPTVLELLDGSDGSVVPNGEWKARLNNPLGSLRPEIIDPAILKGLVVSLA